VFGAAWDGSCAFFANLFFQFASGGAGVDVLRLRGLSDSAVEVGMCGYEFAFALVPEFEDVLRGGTAKDAGVDEACETDAGDVARGAEDAFEIPDGFRSVRCQSLSMPSPNLLRFSFEMEEGSRFRIDLIQKPTSILKRAG
jgi:hypothetical protein